MNLLKLRLRKLFYCIIDPFFWRALKVGVAPAIEHKEALGGLVVDGIIDVGANRGQFSLLCGRLFPSVSIVAVEPIPTEAAKFKKINRRSRNVDLVQTALGDYNGLAALHLSKDTDSSSLLPITKLQTSLFENTREVDQLTVPVSRLDDMAQRWRCRKKQLLKIDVQGFELQVLRGGIETLKSCAYVYVECSEVSLYEGQALREEVEEFMNSHGFRRIGRHNEHWDGDQLVQADYLFASEPESNSKDLELP